MNRRLILRTFGVSALWFACGDSLVRAAQAACSALGITPAQAEGPYYKRNPPQRAFFVEPGVTGEPLLVTGRVVNNQCLPIAGARVDFWQADSAGVYDNAGYRLRGYQVTDAGGRYRLQTIVPGLYPGRTRHLHVKITPPSGRTLTTQLYFPGEPENANDDIFDAALVLNVSAGSTGRRAEYDFSLNG